MLKRLLFFVLTALFFGLQVNSAEGEMEGLPAQDAEQVAEQPLLPPSPDTADGEEMPSPAQSAVAEDATTNPQQEL